HCVGLMLRAFSPSGFGSRWLSWENSTSGNEFSPVCAIAAGTIESNAKRSGIRRIEVRAANLMREVAQASSLVGQPGILPGYLHKETCRQAAEKSMRTPLSVVGRPA